MIATITTPQIKTVRSIAANTHPDVCAVCERHRILCICHLPYPTKTFAYSRAQFDADMDGLDLMDTELSKLRANDSINSRQLDKAVQNILLMRKLCRGRIYRTRIMMQSKQVAGMDNLGPRDKHGVLLSTFEAQHSVNSGAKAITEDGYVQGR